MKNRERKGSFCVILAVVDRVLFAESKHFMVTKLHSLSLSPSLKLLHYHTTLPVLVIKTH